MPLDEFREMAREPLNAPPKDASPEELERHFWRNVTLNPPLYGADVPGSLFDVQCKVGRAGWGGLPACGVLPCSAAWDCCCRRKQGAACLLQPAAA